MILNVHGVGGGYLAPLTNDLPSKQVIARGESVWTARDLRCREEWNVSLSDFAISAGDLRLGNAVRGVLPELSGVARHVDQILNEGVGVVRVSGFDARGTGGGLDAYLALCRAVGTPRVSDDSLEYGHVTPAAGEGPVADYKSAATSSAAVALHTEHARAISAPRVVAFLCVSTATHGGDTVLVSGGDAHNRALECCPTAVARLYRPVPMARHPSVAAESVYDDAPVFSAHAGQLSVRYPRYWIERALPQADSAHTGLAVALADWNSVIDDEEAWARVSLETGDAIFVRNDRVLHGRTSFSAGKGTIRQRHLVRVLLD